MLPVVLVAVSALPSCRSKTDQPVQTSANMHDGKSAVSKPPPSSVTNEPPGNAPAPEALTQYDCADSVGAIPAQRHAERLLSLPADRRELIDVMATGVLVCVTASQHKIHAPVAWDFTYRDLDDPGRLVVVSVKTVAGTRGQEVRAEIRHRKLPTSISCLTGTPVILPWFPTSDVGGLCAFGEPALRRSPDLLPGGITKDSA